MGERRLMPVSGGKQPVCFSALRRLSGHSLMLPPSVGPYPERTPAKLSTRDGPQDLRFPYGF